MQRLQTSRPGFTLIELLVVIAIIAILVALTMVGIVPILRQGPQLRTTDDVHQLTIAMNTFKQKFGMLPPSRVTLSADPAKMDANSLYFVNALWPRIAWSDPAVTIDWAGTGLPRATLRQQAAYNLEGDQALVFWLGGIPDRNAPGCKGFSSNPRNPTDLSSGTIINPLFQFDSSRLYKRSGGPFYSYKDHWKKDMPYVFFSSGRAQNGYNATSDFPGIANGPYYESTNPRRYLNPNSFQIISAGQNGLFGQGGLWIGTNATAIGEDGKDDQVNFHDALLGVPK